MTKKHFIALADKIRQMRVEGIPLTNEQINALAVFCQSQNSNFARGRWIAYINGDCGPNGGARK